MMNTGFILPPDLMDQIGDEKAKMERAELQAYRDIACTYTPNGTPDELQACIEACEDLTVPDGWDNWSEWDIFTLAAEQDNYDEMVMESSVYQQDLEALQDEIDELEVHRKNVHKLQDQIDEQEDKIVELRAWVERNQDEIDRLRTVIDKDEEGIHTSLHTIMNKIGTTVVEGSADAEIALLKSKLETSLWCNKQQGKLLTGYHERLWSGGLIIGHKMMGETDSDEEE